MTEDQTIYQIINSEFNRVNYENSIGNRYYNPPAYAQVKKAKPVQMIGMSLSACIRSIVTHEYVTDDVLYIICGTKMKNETDELEVITQYSKSFWSKLNRDEFEKVFYQLKDDGKLIQPLNYMAYTKINPTAESATYGIWLTPKQLIDRMIIRARKAIENIRSNWGSPISDHLNQLESANNWLRMLDDYKISPNPIDNEFVQRKRLGLNL